jgi:tellurite resistance protein
MMQFARVKPPPAMSRLSTGRLTELRDQLARRGQRKSMVFLSAAPDVLEAIGVVEEYGAVCEAIFLVMAVERRMLNVQRQLLRGALDVISGGRVRTAHMEAMLDAAAKRLATDGLEKRIARVVESLADDAARAETMVVLATAVAAADGKVTEEEQTLLDRLTRDLGVDSSRLTDVLGELTAELAPGP